MIHSSRKFHYDHDTNTFSAWISELGKQPFGRIFDDACDDGLKIVSNKTGVEALFYVIKIEKAADGDIQVWHLKPTDCTIRRLPLLSGATVIVFNT